MKRSLQRLAATRNRLREAMRRARFNRSDRLYTRLHQEEARVARQITRLKNQKEVAHG